MKRSADKIRKVDDGTGNLFSKENAYIWTLVWWINFVVKLIKLGRVFINEETSLHYSIPFSFVLPVITGCDPNPCDNDGRCIQQDSVDAPQCECPIGYTGTLCNIGVFSHSLSVFSLMLHECLYYCGFYILTLIRSTALCQTDIVIWKKKSSVRQIQKQKMRVEARTATIGQHLVRWKLLFSERDLKYPFLGVHLQGLHCFDMKRIFIWNEIDG